MSVLSYNQIIELFTAISEAHYQIKRFGTGELSEADLNKFISENPQYPVFWATPVNVQSAPNTILYQFNLLFFDIVNKDKNNEQEVLSDTLQIALDVYRILKLENEEFGVVGDPTISPFAGRYSEWVAGWAMDIQIEVIFQDNLCDIPYEGLNLTQLLQNFTGGGIDGFGCDDLQSCIDIINIQNNITTLFGNTITGGTYFSGTSTLELYNQSGGTIQITGITSGGGSQIIGNRTEIAYFNPDNNLTGDTFFTRDVNSNFDTNIAATDGNDNGKLRVAYNEITIEVEDNVNGLANQNQFTPTSSSFNVVNSSTGEFSGFDFNGAGGSFRYFDSVSGLSSGYFYLQNQIGYNVIRSGTQYTYNFPQSAYVAGGILTDPNGDGNLQWDLPQDTGTGGGGIPYYLNLSNSQTPYREFSPIATNAAEQTSGVSIGNGATRTIAEFLTPVDYPNSNLLPGGVWTFHLHSYKQNNNASFNIFVEVYKRTSGGTETLLFTTDPAPVTTNSPNPSMQISDAYFSGTPLLVSDRLVAKVRATNTSNQTHTITLFTEGQQHYSYATTTFAVLGLTCGTLSGCSTIQTIETNISNKLDKSGGTITDSLIIQSGLTGNTINISTTPTLNNSPTQILSRNASTGRIEYTEPSQYLNEASTDQIYGSGFDGDVVMDGTNTYAAFTTKVGSAYTLTRTIYTNNLTLSNNATLNPNGFGIYVKGTLAFNDFNCGIISNGNNGGNATAGTAGTGGTSRAAAATNYIIMNCGAAGGNGGNTSSNAVSITVGTNYVGGIGGSGGPGFPTGNSGVGTTTTRGLVNVTAGILQQPYSNNYLSHSLYFGSVQMFAGHSGAGGQCGINAGGGIQGAGGGGGTATRGVVIIANTINMTFAASPTGNIQSQGGAGGNGGNGGGTNATGGGGGGGGGGGFIYIITNTLTYVPNNRIRAAGGAGGLGGTCVGTVNGQAQAGLRSQSGSNGVDGYIVIINPVSGTNTVYTGLY